MKRKEAITGAKKRIVIVRKLRRVVINRKEFLPLVKVSAIPPAVKRVFIHKRPIETQQVSRIETPVFNPPVQTESVSTKKQPDRWSECGQIYFTGGKAYGISPSLRTIFVGEQPYVESFLQDGILARGLTEVQKEALRRIKTGKTLELAATRS